MEQTTQSRRSGSIDLVKSVAILSVLFVHAFTACFRSPIGTADWYGGMFLSAAARAGVPLFFMASGALMLRPEKELPLSRLFTKYLPRLLIALFFWAFVYHCYDLWETGSFSGAELWHRFKSLFFFQHEEHLYFLHISLLFYAMLPLLRVFVRHADRKTLRYALLLWFAAGILLPTLRPYYPYKLFTGIPVQWMLNMTWASLGYGLLGWMISASRPKAWLGWLLLAAGLGATFGGSVLASLRKGALDASFLSGFSVNVCLYAAGIFTLCHCTEPKRLAAPLRFLSTGSFCVYLSHMLVIKRLKLFGFMNLSDVSVLMIPLTVLAVLPVCLLLYWLLSKIPVVRKWLI